MKTRYTLIKGELVAYGFDEDEPCHPHLEDIAPREHQVTSFVRKNPTTPKAIREANMRYYYRQKLKKAKNENPQR